MKGGIMEITKEMILNKTNYGLNIYAYILRCFYPDETVINSVFQENINLKNPFTKDSTTLCIRKTNGSSNHWDTIDTDFTGDCFDFAELYYNLNGQDLLIKLNNEMNLHIEDTFQLVPDTNTPVFSYFEKPIYTKFPAKEVSILDVYDTIRLNKFEKVTQSLRNLDSKDAARKFKAQHFDYVTFSGTFHKRNANDLIQHSGFICFDFDEIEDIESLKKLLIKESQFETELIFTSPSGNGLKWVISFHNNEFSHSDYFTAVLNYFKLTHNIEIDPSGSDVSRACFLCYDKHVYINFKHFENER